MSDVNVIQTIIGKQPLGFGILDKEFDIWRHPRGLNGTQIYSCDDSIRKLISH